MRKQSLKLRRPDMGDQIENRYRLERDGRLKTRLLCVKLAARGEHNAAEIAELCGVSRATVFEWLGTFRREGFEALLERGKPGPRPGELRGLSEAVAGELRAGVASGRWASAEAARQWLESAHGIRWPYVTVWQWLKKIRRGTAGAAAQTPRGRPSSGRRIQSPTGRTLGRSGSAGRAPGSGLGDG